MAETAPTEKVEEFKERWRKRAERIEEKELSAKECKRIYESLHNEWESLIYAHPLELTELSVWPEFNEIEGEVQVALSTAQSRYEKNNDHWIVRAFQNVEKIVIRIFP